MAESYRPPGIIGKYVTYGGIISPEYIYIYICSVISLIQLRDTTLSTYDIWRYYYYYYYIYPYYYLLLLHAVYLQLYT